VTATLSGYVDESEEVEVASGGGEKAVALTLESSGPTTRRRWPILITGLTLGGLGIVGGIAGGVLVGTKKCLEDVNNDGTATTNTPCDLGKQRTTGGVLIGAAVLFIGVGIPLTVIGAKPIPVEPKPTAWNRPNVFVGPANATLQWAF